MNEIIQKCRYCNSKEIAAYKKIDEFIICYCEKCHLLFTASNVVDIKGKVNKEWYSDQYISNYLKQELKLKKRFRQKIQEIELVKKGGKLLDLGCGVGLFLETMLETANYKWVLHGVEINEGLIVEAKRRLGQKISNLHLGRLTTLRFEKDFFDCITCFDVLEHDDQLESTLREIKRILKPSGTLLIQSPNQFSAMSYLCGALWDWWAVPDHIFHFNPRSLSSILVSKGFHIRKLYTWDPQADFILNIQGAIRARFRARSLIGRLAARGLYIPLLLLWKLLSIVEIRFNIGGLLVISAEG
ncbi:MAG: methyltransferase domain-containing protein [Patescibacteria group bacterium]